MSPSQRSDVGRVALIADILCWPLCPSARDLQKSNDAANSFFFSSIECLRLNLACLCPTLQHRARRRRTTNRRGRFHLVRVGPVLGPSFFPHWLLDRTQGVSRCSVSGGTHRSSSPTRKLSQRQSSNGKFRARSATDVHIMTAT